MVQLALWTFGGIYGPSDLQEAFRDMAPSTVSRELTKLLYNLSFQANTCIKQMFFNEMGFECFAFEWTGSITWCWRIFHQDVFFYNATNYVGLSIIDENTFLWQ